jgi:hypothetical protein
VISVCPDAVGEQLQLADVVRREQHRPPLGAGRLEEAANQLVFHDRVHAAERLVHQQQRRTRRQHAQQRRLHALSA